MQKYDFTLEEILNDDPFGALIDNEKPKNFIKSETERIIEEFEKINQFYLKTGKEPTKSRDISERKLAASLEGFRANDMNRKIVQNYDVHNLLGPLPKAESIEDIFENDFLGIFENNVNDAKESIFNIKHIPTKEEMERESADFVAQRKPCKNFEEYEDNFKQVHKELETHERYLIPFKERNIKEGNYFLLRGMLVYIESIDMSVEKQNFKTGHRTRVDGRTRCIFENGTESNLLFRSLVKALNLNGRTITNPVKRVQEQMLTCIENGDRETGYIYVLKSKSENANIKNIPNLYKIGYSRNKVSKRISNAERETTYLMAEVEEVASWKCYNMNTHKFEQLIHAFFGEVCLDINIIDGRGRIQKPREWFTIPFSEIEIAIKLIVQGNILNYRYDKEIEKIVEESLCKH